jgi:hypothetical protein
MLIRVPLAAVVLRLKALGTAMLSAAIMARVSLHGLEDHLRIPRVHGVKAKFAMGSQIGCINPRDDGFEGIFGWLLSEATKSPFLGLRGLECFEAFE